MRPDWSVVDENVSGGISCERDEEGNWMSDDVSASEGVR